MFNSHLNSVDKDEHGDYLISGRHADTIYKISGKDGSVVWRLGGKKSSFQLNGFTFSRQHDARFRGMSENGRPLVSFLDNASDGIVRSATASAGYLVELDTQSKPMVARLLKSWGRPDSRLTNLRGNVQMLHNGNTFVSWSENGYVSEFDTNGDVVLEAQWSEHRLVTYRAYKFEWTGTPVEPIACKAFAIGSSTEDVQTVQYVSWNGATEIASWIFYGASASSGSHKIPLGSKIKTGFETVFAAPGYWERIYAEAIDANGDVLGISEAITTSTTDWYRGSPSDSIAPVAPQTGSMPATLTVPNNNQCKHFAMDTNDEAAEDEADVAVPQQPTEPKGQFITFLDGLALGVVLGTSLAAISILIARRSWLRRMQPNHLTGEASDRLLDEEGYPEK